MLYMNVPIVYGLLFTALNNFYLFEYTIFETIGLFFSTGIFWQQTQLMLVMN